MPYEKFVEENLIVPVLDFKTDKNDKIKLKLLNELIPLLNEHYCPLDQQLILDIIQVLTLLKNAESNEVSERAFELDA
jgi:hypothetical protein